MKCKNTALKKENLMSSSRITGRVRFFIHLFTLITAINIIGFAPILAHEAPQHRIEAINLEIDHNQNNAELYLKRGELHRISFHLDLALADFNRVVQLDPEHESIAFHRGRLLFETGKFQQASAALSLFLRKHPNHVEGLTIQGRVLRKLGQSLEAVQNYKRAISLSPNPTPVLFIEQAEALSEAGEEYLADAIKSLDEGIQTLGPLIVLESLLIDFEAKRQHYDTAIARLDQIVKKMSRKEKWLMRRGEILEKAGRSEEALVTYKDALKSVESLPSRLRQLPASHKLETDIHIHIDRTRRYLQSSPVLKNTDGFDERK